MGKFGLTLIFLALVFAVLSFMHIINSPVIRYRMIVNDKFDRILSSSIFFILSILCVIGAIKWGL